MNLTLLRSFWHVAAQGSVSGAAQKAFISQPALSKAVRELENQVGMALFERGARGVKLTEAGTTLFGYAQAIFALESDAQDALRSHHALEGVTLRIGATPTLATYVLPPILAAFRAKYPGVRFSLARDNTRHIEARLLQFEFDVALVEGPPHSPKIEKLLWRDEELVLVCAPQHSLAAQSEVTPADLQSCAWLVREIGSGTREVVETALQPWDLPPASATEIEGAECLKQAVAADLGIGCVSREAAADQIALGKLRVLNLPGFTLRRPFHRLHLSARLLSPAARAFDQFLSTGASQPEPIVGNEAARVE